MKTKLDMNRIARGLRADRRGQVSAKGGYFGALQLLADIQARFRVPSGGGRPTDPRWTERRLVPLASKTLDRLEKLTARIREQGDVSLEPMQLAALLLEKTTAEFGEGDVQALVRRGPDPNWPSRPRGATPLLRAGDPGDPSRPRDRSGSAD